MLSPAHQRGVGCERCLDSPRTIRFVTQQDALSDLARQWKEASDRYFSAWQQATSQVAGSESAEAMTREARDHYLGAMTNLKETSRQIAEPMVELAGGVPYSEFRRLFDQLHTALMRLDLLDDALQRIEARLDQIANAQAVEPREKPARRKKKS